MHSLTVTIPAGDRSMALHTAWPNAGEGPHAAIVVIMHAGGVDTFVHAMLARLVEAGYFVAAPDLYHRLDARQGDMMDKSMSTPRWIICVAMRWWMRSVSALSAFAWGAASPISWPPAIHTFVQPYAITVATSWCPGVMARLHFR